MGFSFLEGIHHFKKTRLVEIKCWTDHGKEVEIEGQDITEGLLALTKLPVARYLASGGSILGVQVEKCRRTPCVWMLGISGSGLCWPW